MASQPFDYYKSKNVEYDYVLQATVKVKEFTSNDTLSLLLNDEDLLGMYFPQVGLGRVYSKFEYFDDKLHFTFGISLVDARDTVNSKILEQDIKDFLISLNKNLEQEPKLKIKEGDIKVEILSENKELVDNLDKKLVTEGTLSFSKANEIQSLVLTSDGIVEQYRNQHLCNTIPFSKLGVIRECKGLLANGYTLTLSGWSDLKTEAMINDKLNDDNQLPLDNPDKTKEDLRQEIKDVEEIQDLKDELDAKVDMLYEDDTDSNEYVVVIYTNINDKYEPDVLLNSEDGSIADDIDTANRFNEETANKLADIFTDKNRTDDNMPKFIAKAVKVSDLDNLKGLYENRIYGSDTPITEDLSGEFPSSKFTSEPKTANQLSLVNIEKDLSIEQIAWLQAHIGSIYEIEDGLRNFAKSLDLGDEPIISLDKYFNKLESSLKGEE